MSETKGGITFHVTTNEELCKDGKPHDWQGWTDLHDEKGNISGGTTVCAVCGLNAMAHSLRFGP